MFLVASLLVYSSKTKVPEVEMESGHGLGDFLRHPCKPPNSAGVKSRTLLTQAQGTFITVAALTRDYMAPHFSVLIMLSQHSCSLTYTLPKGSQRVGRVLGRFTLTIHTKESALALPPSPATILRIVSHLTLTFKGRCYESHFIGFRSEVYSLAFIFSLR